MSPGPFRAGPAGFLLALAWLVACASPVTVGGTLPAGHPLPAERLEGLVAREAAVTGLRGIARVSLDGQRGEAFAKQVVVVSRPSKLRVEVLGLLNQRIAVLASDGERYDLYRAGQPGTETGPVRPSVLLEVAGLPLVPEEAVALLLGAPRVSPDGWRAGPAVALDGGGLRIQLDVPPGSVGRSFEFDGEGVLRRYRVQAPGGELLLDVRYADVRPVEGLAFAHEIAFEFPTLDSRAQVAFREIELASDLPDSLFRLR